MSAQIPSPTDYPVDALPVGRILEGYRIISVLGRGAFGITYLASEEKLDRLVAIKEYLPEDFAIRDESSTVRAKTGGHGELFEYGRASFLREAKTLVKFKHDNIVRVLTFFEHYDTAYLVMEYEKGVDFRHYLKQKQYLSQTELLSIFIPINQGLSMVHEFGFIHRDIKPANIYIREDNSPVLLDFGAARDVVKNKVDELTRILTEGYAPYEQDNPAWSDQGPWTDIYALGATLYMAVMARKPVSASERAAAFMMKKDDPYVSVATVKLEGYTPGFLAAIDKALAFHPQNRPQSLNDWNRTLTQMDEDATVMMPKVTVADYADGTETQPWGFAEATARTITRKPGSVSGISGKVLGRFLVAGLALALGAGYFWLASGANDEKSSDSQTASKNDPADRADQESQADDRRVVDAPSPPKNTASNEALEGAITQAMLFARTAVVQYATAQANKRHLDEYKAAFSSDNNRTAFIVALQKKIKKAERDFEKNFSQYSIALIKLTRFEMTMVTKEANRFLAQPDYASEISYQKLGRVVVKHVENGMASSANWKQDLIDLSASPGVS